MKNRKQKKKLTSQLIANTQSKKVTILILQNWQKFSPSLPRS